MSLNKQDNRLIELEFKEEEILPTLDELPFHDWVIKDELYWVIRDELLDSFRKLEFIEYWQYQVEQFLVAIYRLMATVLCCTKLLLVLREHQNSRDKIKSINPPLKLLLNSLRPIKFTA